MHLQTLFGNARLECKRAVYMQEVFMEANGQGRTLSFEILVFIAWQGCWYVQHCKS